MVSYFTLLQDFDLRPSSPLLSHLGKKEQTCEQPGGQRLAQACVWTRGTWDLSSGEPVPQRNCDYY